MFSKNTYIARRAQLRQKLQGRGLVVLFGNGESPINYASNAYRFRQDSSFLYFFGLAKPGLAAIIDTDTGTETLFGDDFTLDDIVWMGPQSTIRELAASVGVSQTAPANNLAGTIAGAQAKNREIHILPPYRPETKSLIHSLISNIQPSEDLIRAVVAMRDKKTEEEVAEIEKACATGREMFALAMRMCSPEIVARKIPEHKITEREIAALMEGIALSKGWGTSFSSIVSQHGETLHNIRQDGVLTAGRLLLVDAGAETLGGYASDNTRTIPVGGQFSVKQKDIYDIVLAANNHAFKISKPDVKYVDVHISASRVLLEGLHGLGLVRGNIDDALSHGTHALFMPHGLGHQMGLDVHDMESFGENFVGYDVETPRSTNLASSKCRMGRKLQSGMVVTVEPGIYFIPDLVAKWRADGTCREFLNFDRLAEYSDFGGIRLEDDMLITPNGNRLLSVSALGAPAGRIPITTDDVERAVMS